MVALDDLRPLLGLPPPDFVKVDVEGFEDEVLRGARRTIEAHRPALMVEVHGLTPRDKEAAALLDRALAMWEASDAEPEGRIDAGVARAQLFYREKRVDRAASTMAAALDAVEALRPYRGGGGEERMEFVRRYVDAYDRMTAWQVELGNAPSALEYSERRRARVLVDRLSGTTSMPLDDEERASEWL